MHGAAGKASDVVLDTGILSGPASPSIVTLHDFSRGRNHGAMTAVTWEQQPSRVWGMDYNGTTSTVNCGNDGSLDITDSISIELWIYLKTLADQDFCHRYSVWAANGYKLFGVAAGNYRFLTNASLTGNTVLQINRWYHIVAVQNSTVYKRLYLNGNLDGEALAPAALVSPGAQNYLLGTAIGGTVATLSGYIALNRVYRYALTPGQILQHYEATKFLFGGH